MRRHLPGVAPRPERQRRLERRPERARRCQRSRARRIAGCLGREPTSPADPPPPHPWDEHSAFLSAVLDPYAIAAELVAAHDRISLAAHGLRWRVSTEDFPDETTKQQAEQLYAAIETALATPTSDSEDPATYLTRYGTVATHAEDLARLVGPNLANRARHLKDLAVRHRGRLGAADGHHPPPRSFSKRQRRSPHGAEKCAPSPIR
ncbi:hypothetical protein ACFQX6_67115 [Streptosporangium lutulentum]